MGPRLGSSILYKEYDLTRLIDKKSNSLVDWFQGSSAII